MKSILPSFKRKYSTKNLVPEACELLKPAIIFGSLRMNFAASKTSGNRDDIVAGFRCFFQVAGSLRLSCSCPVKARHIILKVLTGQDFLILQLFHEFLPYLVGQLHIPDSPVPVFRL
jgi:hypothetical protein